MPRQPTPIVSEADLRKFLLAEVKRRGGQVRKVRWVGRVGAPDELVMLTRAAGFLELKRPGRVPTATQWREIGGLWRHGLIASWASTREEVIAFLDRLEDAGRRRRT